jgi:DNA polymerase III delta subunit
MLHIIYGKDREKGRARFRALREELGKKCGDERALMEGEISKELMHEMAATQGLFGGENLFVFDCVFDKKAEQEVLLEHANELRLSPNSFLVFEPELDKKIGDEIKATKAEVEEYASKKIDTRPDFNIFSLGDALGQRNKKELWVLYQEALAADLTPEEICGTLFWAVKNIALLKNAKPGNDMGVSPFVAKKTRVFAKNYTQEEIANLSRSLVTAYHEAHRGAEPMDVALERFILGT